MKKLSISFALVLIVAGALAAQAQTVIKSVDFSNFSYDTSMGEPKTVKLTSGKFEDGGTYDAGFPLYELFGKPVYADLNGDKSIDAVVELKMSAPSTLRAFEVQAFTFANGAAKMLARVDSEQAAGDYKKYFPKNSDLHYAGVNSPKIQNGRVIVEALTEGSFACPKYTALFTYKLSGDKFVLAGKPVRKAFACDK